MNADWEIEGTSTVSNTNNTQCMLRNLESPLLSRSKLRSGDRLGKRLRQLKDALVRMILVRSQSPQQTGELAHPRSVPPCGSGRAPVEQLLGR
eukprot:3151417-Amphidinium_carterae.2